MTTQHGGFFQHLDKQRGRKKKKQGKKYKITAIELDVQCTRKVYRQKKRGFIKIRIKANYKNSLKS